MSGRIRSIKPEILEDEVAIQLPDDAWRLWVSLWVLADDYGNVRLGDRLVASLVWQDTMRDVSGSIRTLIEKRFVSPYAVRGQRYGHINGWDKHQRVDNAGKPRVPLPEEDDGSWDDTAESHFAETRGEPRRTAASDGESPLRARAQTRNPAARPTTTTTTNDPERDRARARGPDGSMTALPDEFELTSERKAYAETVGVTDIEAVFRKFGNVMAERGKLSANWDASWRTFCDNELRIQYRDRSRRQAQGPGIVADRSPARKPMPPLVNPHKAKADG